MNFNRHYDLEGKHAFLSASNYHWLNYDVDRLTERYYTHQAVEMGTKMHEFAAQAINLRVKLTRTRQTLNMYVNDAIGYRMTPEQPLFYSENCFGTADAIAFNGKFLRIHDLKTGQGKASFKQLEIYAALFCLEYGIDPRTIDMELRIYQYDDFTVEIPDPNTILKTMDTIVEFDRVIKKLKMEG